MDPRDSYRSAFRAFEAATPSEAPSWLRNLRQHAIARFGELGFPTTKLEDWKYTNVAPLAQIAFQPVWAYQKNGLRADAIDAVAPGTRLVLVDGHCVPDLCALDALPRGVEVTSLAAAIASHPTLVEPHLGRYARPEDNGFVALNTAFLHDGAFIYIPPGSVLPEPIHVVFVSSASSQPTVAHPRSLVVAEAGAQAMLVETYVGAGTTAHFTNAVTEIVAAPDSVLEHCTVELEGPEGFHVAALETRQSRASSLTAHGFSFGGGLVRQDINVVLDGEGAECVLNGLFVAGGHGHVDNHTTIDHAQPHCTSLELYKGILRDQATGIFNGRIRVRPQAQKTNARQTNNNLLLSDDAQINTKPQLEIYADDVKCFHGSTIGQLDGDALFYLQSRGLDLRAARRLLTYGFASEMVNRIKATPLRERLEQRLLGALPAESAEGGR
jgi:Fe-S cluster assembly protein SufD